MELYHYFMLNYLLKKHSNKSFNSRGAGFNEFDESSLLVFEQKKGGVVYFDMPVYLLIRGHAKKLGLTVEFGTYEWWNGPDDNPICSNGATPGIMIDKTDRIKTKGTACMAGMFYPLYMKELPALANPV